MFKTHIGIDYSGAKTANARLSGLRVFAARDGGRPQLVSPPTPGSKNVKNWTRREVHGYCTEAITRDERIIIGIDHAFGFPMDYLRRNGIKSWDAFLDDFAVHWPATEPDTTVESLREGNRRSGDAKELRRCERWTAGAKSVFRFDVNGQVAKSSHAGIPWLHQLRRCPELTDRVHWWPFDGFEVPDGKSVIAEVYPSIFRNRYERDGRTIDEQDAYAAARWLADMDQRGLLGNYFNPPLSDCESHVAALDGTSPSYQRPLSP